MPNIALILKNEISRVARKELRNEIQSLKKAVNAYRGEIAALKRRAQSLEQQVGRLTKKQAKVLDASPAAAPGDGKAIRFSSKSLMSQRRRLALSAEECGLLVGTSSQSIYNWEQGKARPRASHLPAIAALRGLGKREAAAKIAELRDAA